MGEALAILDGIAAEGRMMDAEMRGLWAWLRKNSGLPPPEGEGFVPEDRPRMVTRKRGTWAWMRRVFGLPPPEGEG